MLLSYIQLMMEEAKFLVDCFWQALGLCHWTPHGPLLPFTSSTQQETATLRAFAFKFILENEERATLGLGHQPLLPLWVPCKTGTSNWRCFPLQISFCI
jgi:hypothetical protein